MVQSCRRRAVQRGRQGAASRDGSAKRKALFATMLDAWEDACPGTILYQPFETYAVKRKVAWTPYSFFFMDLRPDNLSFG